MTQSILLSENTYQLPNALCWGNCAAHWQAYQSETEWSCYAFIHLTLALSETLPFVGQIVSIFEMCLAWVCYSCTTAETPVTTTVLTPPLTTANSPPPTTTSATPPAPATTATTNASPSRQPQPGFISESEELVSSANSYSAGCYAVILGHNLRPTTPTLRAQIRIHGQRFSKKILCPISGIDNDCFVRYCNGSRMYDKGFISLSVCSPPVYSRQSGSGIAIEQLIPADSRQDVQIELAKNLFQIALELGIKNHCDLRIVTVASPEQAPFFHAHFRMSCQRNVQPDDDTVIISDEELARAPQAPFHFDTLPDPAVYMYLPPEGAHLWAAQIRANPILSETRQEIQTIQRAERALASDTPLGPNPCVFDHYFFNLPQSACYRGLVS